MSGAKSSPQTAERIFVVDDDRGLSRLIEKALQREGFQTASATSFTEALDWLRQHEPDLMLLDLKLDEIGGKELIDHLTAQGRTVPFIVITGQGDERVAVAMMKRGAIDYIVKDVSFLELVPEIVRRALGQLQRDRKLSSAEEALRRSESNLAKAQQIAHLGSFEIHIPFSERDYRSDEIYRILGLDRAQGELSTEAYLEQCVHPRDRECYRETLNRAAREGAPFNFEYRVVRPDGSVRHVQSVGEPMIDASGKVARLVGALLDITERKRGELRQRVQYATTQALAESASLGEAAPRILDSLCQTLDWDFGQLWRIDSSSTSTLSSVAIWHAQEMQVSALELCAQELVFQLGLAWPGLASTTSQPVWTADIARDERFHGAVIPAEGIHCAVAFPILLRGEVLGAVVLLSRALRPLDADLCQLFSVVGSQIGQFLERKRAEEALRKEHAFIAAVLDTSAALVLVLDRRGHIVRFNRACEQTTGYSLSEVQGRSLWERFLLPEEADAAKAVFEKVRAGQLSSRHENYLLTRDGGKRLIAWSNSALFDDYGSVEYVISIGIDVTERRRLEKEILQISEMEQRRIGQDLHDGLCQQLAGTELMTETLEQKLAKKSKADAARVGEIARQVREAISQTRLLARGLSPVVVESEGLMSALEELAEYSARTFHVRCEFQCVTPVLIHDHSAATHMYRIAQEAISNAIRHGRAKRIVVSLKKVGDRNVLRVKDDGAGLPKDVSKAKGMGLRIMQYRATMINASLVVQNEAEGGSSVTCSIQSRPAHKESNPHYAQESKTVETDRPYH